MNIIYQTFNEGQLEKEDGKIKIILSKANMNRVMLVGSVGTEPKKVSEGIVFINVVVTGEYNTTKRKFDTDLVPVKCRGKLADYVLKEAKKGQQIEIEGKMASRKTENGFYSDVEGIQVRLGHESMKNRENL